MQSLAFELVCRLAPQFDAGGFRWAIGGGVALRLHGLERVTRDVDLFVADADRGLLQVLRDHGAAPGMFSSQHARAYVPGGEAADLIDVFFPRLEPLRSAIGRADVVHVDGAGLPVLRLFDVALAKVVSESPKDGRDVELLLRTGRVTAEALRAALPGLGPEPPATSPYVRRHCNLTLARERLDKAA